MKITRLTLVHDFKYEVLYFKNKNSATAFLNRTSDNYTMDTLTFKQDNKLIYSVRSVGNMARVVGVFSDIEEAKQKAKDIGTARPGAYSDIHSYKILMSYKPATIFDIKGKFVTDFSRSSLE